MQRHLVTCIIVILRPGLRTVSCAGGAATHDQLGGPSDPGGLWVDSHLLGTFKQGFVVNRGRITLLALCCPVYDAPSRCIPSFCFRYLHPPHCVPG